MCVSLNNDTHLHNGLRISSTSAIKACNRDDIITTADNIIINKPIAIKTNCGRSLESSFIDYTKDDPKSVVENPPWNDAKYIF